MTLRLLLAFSTLILAATADAQCRFDPLDRGRVVKISGAQLPAASAMELSALSVMRVEGGRFVPVAYQFDEMDQKGMVWFEDSGFALAGSPGQLDADDQLLMMLTDAGPHAPEGLEPEQGEVISELTVADSCHFYLVRGNNERSGNYYVAHDVDSGETRTALYRLDVDPDNELNWHYLGYRGYQGEGSIIDTLKMRMSAGVLSRFTRMTLDNHNLRPKRVGFSVGPIRSVMHLRTRVVLAGIPVMTIQVQAMRYASHYEAHTYAKIPDLYRATLKEPEVSVTVDGNGQSGAAVYTANFVDNPVIVDGKADDQAFADQTMTMNANWILFDSKRDFALLTHLTVPDELMETPLALIYQDDALLAVEPEQFPGQWPNLGYSLHGWPQPEELRFTVSLFFEDGLEGFAADEFARQRSAVVPVQINQ
ncbi:hypothetical protein T9A_00270 [Alcanivorax jadensis T9]|jgi:hypothetical protein|uniref:DUF4861 domain-containing protein n=1 Tax=Alcanivorax jadensis T9 TaxID=1177181 RepID=A0ABR4WHF0_9GAMM|nr:hypothetical protein [Alcanivorax jadensis]KGD62950.1 hypothetical protein T9A_00270 [Alcanivorax jadensis T9]MBP21437.1 hypothetical protein [Alcanivorax sp.]